MTKTGNVVPAVTEDEHAQVGTIGIGAKKVILLDNDGNQVVPATSASFTDGSQVTKIKEVVPTDSTKLNASLVLAYNASNQLTNIAKTIGGVTYNKILTWTGDVCTAVSSWT